MIDWAKVHELRALLAAEYDGRSDLSELQVAGKNTILISLGQLFVELLDGEEDGSPSFEERVEAVARALWAKEFDRPMEEMRDEPPNEEEAKPGWWVEDVWDAMVDSARTAVVTLAALSPVPTGAQDG